MGECSLSLVRHEHSTLCPVLTVTALLQVSALREEQAPARGEPWARRAR